jgi:S-adenosylmethionine/arginine decarboxylase-like enzyme
VFLDFVNFIAQGQETLEEQCNAIFTIMRNSIKSTKMKNMHDKMVVLKEDTEEGFTSVVLLDESHITAHAYTKRGLLALDVFTCGSTNPEIVARYIKCELEKTYPYIQCLQYQVNRRFLYNKLDEEMPLLVAVNEEEDVVCV